MSEKLFNLMDRSRKSLWTCEKCIKRKNKPRTSTPIIKSHPHKVTTAPTTRKNSTNRRLVTVATGKNKTTVEQEPAISIKSSLSPTPSQNTSLCQHPSPMLPTNLELVSPGGTSMADVCTAGVSLHEVSPHQVPDCSIYVTQSPATKSLPDFTSDTSKSIIRKL
ncbi:unnamed protein product [Parnassius apollo]|uniref:(apollo) hypothetical protein n=1 Tax=Parnassius apollo TaxID=110799 RepID=A0A8S3X0J0_PARAO|nr:unnamed protein product [Parnassius apollo]